MRSTRSETALIRSGVWNVGGNAPFCCQRDCLLEEPMMSDKPVIRTIAIVAAALFAVGTPIVQSLTGTIAVGQGDLVKKANSMLRREMREPFVIPDQV